MARTGPRMQTLARLQRWMLLGGRCLRVKSVGVKIHCCKTWISTVQTRVSPWSCTGSADVVSDHTFAAEHLCMEVENHPKKQSSAQNHCRDITVFWRTGSPAQAGSSDCFIGPTFVSSWGQETSPPCAVGQTIKGSTC